MWSAGSVGVQVPGFRGFVEAGQKQASRMRIDRSVDKLQLAKLSQDDGFVWPFRFQEERPGASHEEFGRVVPGNTPKATAMMSEILVVRSNL